MTFTVIDVGPEDTDLIDAAYQLGVDYPMEADLACSVVPHPLRAEFADAAGRDDRHFFLIYDDLDSTLRCAIVTDTSGMVLQTALRRYSPVGQPATDPRGIEFGAALVAAIKDCCGQALSQSKNPSSAPGEAAAGFGRVE